MGRIGEYERTVVVEPLESPVPVRRRQSKTVPPTTQPVPNRVEPEKEPLEVPA